MLISSTSLQFYAEELFFPPTILLYAVLGALMILCPSLLLRHRSIKMLFFIRNHVTDLPPVDLISSSSCCFFAPLTFPASYCLRPKSFETCCNFKMSQYFSWNSKMSHFQHLIYFLCSVVNKIWIYEISKSLHSVFVSLLFWNWGYTSWPFWTIFFFVSWAGLPGEDEKIKFGGFFLCLSLHKF